MAQLVEVTAITMNTQPVDNLTLLITPFRVRNYQASGGSDTYIQYQAVDQHRIMDLTVDEAPGDLDADMADYTSRMITLAVETENDVPVGADRAIKTDDIVWCQEYQYDSAKSIVRIFNNESPMAMDLLVTHTLAEILVLAND